MQIFHPSRHHLAERGQIPEKNAGSHVFEWSLGGGGPPVGSATRLVAILNQATLPTFPRLAKYSVVYNFLIQRDLASRVPVLCHLATPSEMNGRDEGAVAFPPGLPATFLAGGQEGRERNPLPH